MAIGYAKLYSDYYSTAKEVNNQIIYILHLYLYTFFGKSKLKNVYNCVLRVIGISYPSDTRIF